LNDLAPKQAEPLEAASVVGGELVVVETERAQQRDVKVADVVFFGDGYRAGGAIATMV
jgi:hypothetical protein